MITSQLRASEVIALIMSVEIARAAGTVPFAAGAEHALAKIEQALPAARVAELRTLRERILVGDPARECPDARPAVARAATANHAGLNRSERSSRRAGRQDDRLRRRSPCSTPAASATRPATGLGLAPLQQQPGAVTVRCVHPWDCARVRSAGLASGGGLPRRRSLAHRSLHRHRPGRRASRGRAGRRTRGHRVTQTPTPAPDAENGLGASALTGTPTACTPPSVSLVLPFVSAYGDGGLGLLGDPTRRAIFELLARDPCSVGELAQRLPVSRPAVSQHLRVLKDGGLVTSQAEGTRRVYRINPAGVTALRAYLDRIWDDALTAFQKAAEAAPDDPEQEQP